MTAPLLAFDRLAELLHVMSVGGCTTWRACNNADSTSRGPWPPGIYQPQRLIPISGPDGAPGGSYGAYFLRYDVPGRVGMGVHAGREGDTDGAGRSGPGHATLGCIRTSDAAMQEIARLVTASGELPVLWVAR